MKKPFTSIPLASRNENLLSFAGFEQLKKADYRYIFREEACILEVYTAQTWVGYLQGTCALAAVQRLRLQKHRSLLVLRAVHPAPPNV